MDEHARWDPRKNEEQNGEAYEIGIDNEQDPTENETFRREGDMNLTKKKIIKIKWEIIRPTTRIKQKTKQKESTNGPIYHNQIYINYKKSIFFF